MSLTERQIVIIQGSFKQVTPIAADAAKIFYAKLFEYDPSLKTMFKANMDEQGKKLMKTLGVAIAALRDLDGLVPVLQNLAIKHLDYGVRVEDYTPVGNALIYTLHQGLGAQFTAELKQAWIALLKLVFNVMRSAAYPNYNAKTFHNDKFYNH